MRRKFHIYVQERSRITLYGSGQEGVGSLITQAVTAGREQKGAEDGDMRGARGEPQSISSVIRQD